MSAKQKIKILVVDDHPVVRKGLLSCLAGRDNLKVVGEAGDGNEALRKVRELLPDLVLMDLAIPEPDGLKVTEKLRKEMPQVKVVILSMHSNREYVLRVIKTGARGYVLKDAPPDELVRAIEAVNAGETFFSPAVARIALDQYVNGFSRTDPLARLSERERDVLTRIAEGRSNKEIASDLDIGVRTVETHRERIMQKLEIHSVAGLTKFAITCGLAELNAGGQLGKG